jgi:ABC-type dipeptide/oligopeptide/nickel transport system permease component
MSKVITRRLTMLIPVLLGVTALVFLAAHLAPGDPVLMMLGDEYTEADYLRVRHELGLDRSLVVQYLDWLGKALTGDLGKALFGGQPVIEEIAPRVPTTLTLALGSMVVAVGIAVPLGVWTATRKDSTLDNVARALSMLGVSMPAFWLALVLLLVFAGSLQWFPVGGGMEEYGLKAMILPSLALGTRLAGLATRMTRASMLEVLRQDYIRTARGKGLADHSVYYRHALKNALLPVITVIGLQFGTLLGGAVVTETVFALPGLGRLLVASIDRRDYPLMQGCVLVIALAFVLANLIADLLYGYLDPRIRFE